jgi:hypothetical protein
MRKKVSNIYVISGFAAIGGALVFPPPPASLIPG